MAWNGRYDKLAKEINWNKLLTKEFKIILLTIYAFIYQIKSE